ncbi:MAG TPA: ABC transporter permease [Oceanithermus profundus]|uniref:Transport permease protein n=1 Tax=Oceanithermus profundus TaxID=187137 RepID=A0A7C4Z522_9DEIN|nr:ABC transporter permease [Oceanithermus profundus]
MRWSRVRAVAKKEMLELRRDPILLRVIRVLPVAMLLLFGYAVNFNLKHIPLALLDRADDRISRTLVRELEKDDKFEVVARAESEEELKRLIDRQQARVGLVVPAGLLERIRAGKGVRLRALVDGSDPTFAFQVQVGLQKAVGRLNARLVAARMLAGEAQPLPLALEPELLYNPEANTAAFMVPGIVGIILTQIAVILTGLAIVREKETRMLESLIATPVRPGELVVGKVLPYLVIAFADTLLVLWVGYVVFAVPMRGSLVLLLLLIFLFVLGSLAVGIVVSARARTQIQAIFGTLVYYLPSIFLSGLFFPIEGMPRVLQAVTYLIPLRYFLEAARGVMLRGVGLDVLYAPFAALVVFTALMLALATMSFRKRLL